MDEAYFEEVLMPEWRSRPEVLRGEIALQALPHRDLVSSGVRTCRLDEILDAVSQFSSVAKMEMLSGRRHQQVALPRHVAMHLMRDLTYHSFPSIGRFFGDRDSSTILHGCARITSILEDPEHDDHQFVRSLIDRAKSYLGAA